MVTSFILTNEKIKNDQKIKNQKTGQKGKLELKETIGTTRQVSEKKEN